MKKKEMVVLLVDQNTTRKSNLSVRLRVSGYSTELTSSGFHAIHLLEKSLKTEQKSYNIIVILGDSEDMSGREILLIMRTIITEKKKLPILFVGNDSDPDEILSIIHEGANDYIVDSGNEGQILPKVKKLAPI